MFKEDEPGDVLVVPLVGRETVFGTGAAALVVHTETAPESDPEPEGMKTLRQRLYEREPWYEASLKPGSKVSSGIRRLMEARVNKYLDLVSDWMLDLAVTNSPAQEDLFGIAEDVRQQIAWPERQAREALDALTSELERVGAEGP